MASLISLAIVAAAILAIAVRCAHAEGPDRFHVGGDQGWHVPHPNQPDFYNLWASRIHFRVGDSIYFTYTNDSVLVVEKRGYYHCNTTDPIKAFHEGETTVVLQSPGPAYFISGEPDHCKDGQRLIVNVLAAHPPREPPVLSPPPSPTVVPTETPSPSPVPNSAAPVRSSRCPSRAERALHPLVALFRAQA